MMSYRPEGRESRGARCVVRLEERAESQLSANDEVGSSENVP